MVEVFKNEHYSRGIKLYDNGLLAEAIVEFENVLEEAKERQSPERRLATFYMGEAYASLGKSHLRMNMLDRAEEELKFALALHPDYADLHLSLGAVYYRQRLYNEAEKSIRAALTINPKFARARMYLGLTQLRKGNENGLAEIAGGVMLEPAYDDERYEHAMCLYRDGEAEEALTRIEELAETDLDRIRCLLEKGVQMLESNAYSEALDALIEAVSICPHYADLRQYLGLCYAHRGMMERAIEQFQRAIEINPGFVLARINLAAAYEAVGRISQAAEELRTVLEMDPNNATALERLSTLPDEA